MNEHTHKQFDAEMEAIRTGVLTMGGLVEDQLGRAIVVLAQDESDDAIDLRMILTITKIVNDLERMADEVKKVAYKAAETHGSDRLTEVRYHDVMHAAEHALTMLQMALDAFARLDVTAAAEVIDRDEEIDAAFHSILRQLISYMMEDPRTISHALEIVFIAKSIERIGDHAKNVAEAVVQVVRGKDVRHASAQEIRAEVSDE